MLNIISRSILFKNVSGPKKVVENLIKGLDKIGYPYVINKRLDSCQRLWIHDDRKAVQKICSLPEEIKILIGPNIFTFPSEISEDTCLDRVVYLQPSQWPKDIFLHLGFKGPRIDVWPTGVDTEDFKQLSGKKEFVLIYFKVRDEISEGEILRKELSQIENILQNKNLDYRIIEYRQYKESDYKNLLGKAKYMIWLGMQESQGLALEEALASGVPMIVCDFSTHFVCIKSREDKYYQVTNASYFDNRCGLIIKDASRLGESIDFMEKSWQELRPREYILENLSPEKKAKDLILFFEKYFNLDYQSGFKEKMLRKGNWLNNKFWYIIFLKLKHWLRIILVKLKK